MSYPKLRQKELKTYNAETSQPLLKIKSSMTQLTSPNWDRKTKAEYYNQESRAKETLELHQLFEMAHKSLLHDTTTKAKLETATCHLVDLLKDLKMRICHQGNHQQSTEEMLVRATRDHQLTQEPPMFTLTKTRYSTLNSSHKHQATKTMFQQAFLPDLS